MAQTENFYEPINIHDRKKNSKFEIGDMITIKRVRNPEIKSERTVPYYLLDRTFIIYDKHASKDKNGLYWSYDIFFPDNSRIHTKERLIDNKWLQFVKIV